MRADVSQIKEEILQYKDNLLSLKNEFYKVLVGQENLFSRMMIALLTGGHILMEGVPGLAKTLAVKTLSQSLQVKFHRIQFTPDLLPADLIGTLIYNPRDAVFSTKKGPIFANIILADEINRAPAKVQSALLEAMQEHQVTIGEETFPLEEPFMVMATQNPLEQEGTYPLPEAQVDRFMLKVKIDYPSKKEERLIVERFTEGEQIPKVKPVLSSDVLFKMRDVVTRVYIDEKVKDYIVDLVFATRKPKEYSLPEFEDYIECGASPRASLYLTMAAKASAFLEARGYVTPQDVKNVAYDVLRHRIILSYEAEADEKSSEDILSKILQQVPVP